MNSRENCEFLIEFPRFAAKQFTVRLGDIDLKRNDEPSSPVTFKVSDVRVHPQFSRVGYYNDIAVLLLDRPARKSKYVIPICLPPPELRRETFAGKRTTVVGWGTTYYGGKESTVQRQAVLPVWRNEDCNEAYFQPITSNFICAGYSEGGTDACQVKLHFSIINVNSSAKRYTHTVFCSRYLYSVCQSIQIIHFFLSPSR